LKVDAPNTLEGAHKESIHGRLGDGDYIWITERTAHPVMGKATLKKKLD